MPTSQPTLIESVRRALRLLDAIVEDDRGPTAKHLARRTGIPLATTYHLLRTLTHEGYLQREGGVYAIGSAAARLGAAASRQSRPADMADWLAALRDELGAAVYFALYEEGEVRIAGMASGPNAPASEQWADFRRTAHAHAVGQCLLAQLGEDARREHLARHPVERLTPYTVQDEGALLRRLSRLPRGGPVYQRQEYALGTVCAAVPVTIGDVPATVALSLPASRSHLLEPAAVRLKKRAEGVITQLAFTVRIPGASRHDGG
ncbi:IclR family transcriptional regulator C-terminal domain-containing protein [Streptomyces sp. NPDC020807]|uniref:IclR family transcriptional regulator n=1 Tax=Streptomyces sp. NPDC020807 TaxID=3155119 RepID=UPI0033F116F3